MRTKCSLKCFIMVCLCLLCLSTARADQQLMFSQRGRPMTMTTLAWAENRLFGSDGTWVYEIDPATGEAAMHRGFLARHMAEPEEGVMVAAWQDRLLVLDWHSGTVLLAKDDAVETLVTFSVPSDLTGKGLSQPVCSGNVLYVMVGQTISDLWPELVAIDLMQPGRVQRVDKNVYDLAPWTAGQVLVRKYDSAKRVHQVWALDAQGSSLLTEIEGMNVCGLAADPISETFYLMQDTELMAYSQGKKSRVRSIPRDMFSISAAVLNGQYAALAHSGEYTLYELAEQQKKTLRIRGLYNELSDQGFAMAHPEIALSRTTENELCAQDVYTDILTGDDSTDLYFIACSSGLKTMMEQGYAAPLDGSAVLVQDHARLHSVLAQSLQQDGRLYAVAAYVRYGSWGATVEDGFAAPATLHQALEEQAAWAESPHNAGQPYMGLVQESRAWTALDWLDMALMQVLLGRDADGRVALQSHAGLRSAMEQVKAAYEASGLPMLPEQAEWFSFDQLPALMCFGGSNGYFGLGVNTLNSYPGITPIPAAMPSLLEGEEPRYPAVMMVYILNPRSQHKEEAMAYLEWLAQNRESWEAVWLHTDGADERVVAETLHFYHEEIVPRMVVLADPLLERKRMTTQAVYPAFLEELTQYLTGMKTVDQSLAQMQRVADSWWMESR